MKCHEWHLNELYSFLSNCLLRLCQVPCVKWFYVQEHKATWRRWLHVHVVRRHNWSDAALWCLRHYSFGFFHANCIGLLSLPLPRCWWHLFVLCELHHTFPFSWATHCMTPSDTLHLISPPRSSSLNLSSAVWEPLVPFPFVSSLGHFAGDASTAGFSPSSAENFDPLDPANYYLLSTIWFLIKWIIFLATQEIHVSVKALSFIHYDPQHIFHTLWSFFCKQKPPWGMLMNTVSPPGRREALGLKNSTGLSSMDFRGNPVECF